MLKVDFCFVASFLCVCAPCALDKAHLLTKELNALLYSQSITDFIENFNCIFSFLFISFSRSLPCSVKITFHEQKSQTFDSRIFSLKRQVQFFLFYAVLFFRLVEECRRCINHSVKFMHKWGFSNSTFTMCMNWMSESNKNWIQKRIERQMRAPPKQSSIAQTKQSGRKQQHNFI